jgi:hypothetical protein
MLQANTPPVTQTEKGTEQRSFTSKQRSFGWITATVDKKVDDVQRERALHCNITRTLMD